LTLAFLGDVEEGRLADLKTLRIAGRKHPLPMQQASYWKHNKIVWAGPDATPKELSSLVDDLHRKLKALGFALEDRPFAAHVTLIRKARRPDPPRLPEVVWPVEEVVLVRTRPSSSGAGYEVQERYPLS
jgi:2'-5' RNA ligase